MSKPMNLNGCEEVIGCSYDEPMVIVFRQESTITLPKHWKGTGNKATPEPQTTNSKGSQPFEFIVLEGTAKEGKKARTLARSHVMLGRKNAKGQPKRRFFLFSSKKEDAFRHSGKSVAGAGIHQTTVPPPLPGSLDPFVRYPVPMQPSFYRLLQHYVSVVIPAATARRSEFDWIGTFTSSLTEASHFHQILAGAACHINIQNGVYESPDSYFHKAMALQLANDGISQGRCDDQLLYTISILAIDHAINATEEFNKWKIHTNGMIELIAMRGGISKLPAELQWNIYMEDFAGCVETDSPPSFPIPHPSILTSPPSSPSILAPGFRKLILSPHDPELLSILASLTPVMSLLDQHSSTTTRQQGPDYNIASLRYRLLRRPDSHNYSSEMGINEVCRIGALLFLRLTLFHYPKIGQPYAPLLNKLKLWFGTEESREEGNLGLGIWMGMLAAMVSLRGSKLRGFFVGGLRCLVGKRGAVGWEEMRKVLGEFMWVGGLMDVDGKEVWGEVEGFGRVGRYR